METIGQTETPTMMAKKKDFAHIVAFHFRAEELAAKIAEGRRQF